MNIRQILGRRVRLQRMALGLNQMTFADKVGIPVPTLSSIEHGHQSIYIERAVQLATALGVSTDYLLGLSDTPGKASARRSRQAPPPQPTAQRQRPRKATAVASEDGTCVSSVRCQRPAGVSGPAAVADVSREPRGTQTPPSPPSETSLDVHPSGHSAKPIVGPLYPTPRHEPTRP
jgi:transcriptional regulator with XRE-family HTH domain